MSPSATFIDIVLAFVAAAVVARMLHTLVHRYFGAHDASAERRVALQRGATRLVRLITLMAFGAAGLVALSLLLEHVGVRGPLGRPKEIGDALVNHGIPIVFIIVGAMVVIRTAHLAIEHLEHSLGHGRDQSDYEWQRRASTLAGILTRVVTVVVSFVAMLMLLGQLNLDVMPILTGAGIAGLAVGFGAQNLVRDVISGFFLILEDQVRIGDAARINTISGTVEHINLRTVVLRDGEGAVHVFPNGTITALANLSKNYAYAVVDVRVPCREDINRVLQTLRDVGTVMEREPAWNEYLLEPLDVVGIESIAEAWVLVRVRFKTPPLRQGDVAHELRRQIMLAFAAKKIRPFG